MGFVDSTSQVKFSVISEGGLAYEVTRTKIDTYIANFNRIFKKSCTEHRKLLEKYTEMIAYCQHKKVPYYMRNDVTCPSCHTKTDNGTFRKCSHCFEKAHSEVYQLVAHIRNLAMKIRESEKTSGIAYTNPRDHCLQGFNSMLASRYKVWTSFESLREYFDDHQNGFVVDHFIQRSESFSQTLYWPYLEKMMHKVALKYNEALERARNESSRFWLHKHWFKNDRFVPNSTTECFCYVLAHEPATASEALKGIDSFPRSCNSLVLQFLEFYEKTNKCKRDRWLTHDGLRILHTEGLYGRNPSFCRTLSKGYRID